ncbi:MAG: polymer-forming cytoskeletal protein [Hyphomicrobiales bacterium]|nr:polymer-forming cytoskeletal protein [Hyphomicrobiales bacterium]MCP5372813.1 polymer-forming cytoskeletal protein [Hyphomicrobiales bacterium]
MPSHRNRPISLLLAAVGLLAAVAPALAGDEPVVRTGTFHEDVFATGKEVRVKAEVDGGVIVMGGEVSIRSKVAGDVVAMGGHLEVGEDVNGDVISMGGELRAAGRVAGDVTAMGGDVELDAQVAGNVLATGGRVRLENKILSDLKVAAGKAESTATVAGNAMFAAGKVELGPDSDIAGNAWIVAGRAEVGGKVGKDLRVGAHRVEISGEIMGNVNVDAENIEILPGARIHGNLVYRSPQIIQFDADTVVGGDVTFVQSETSTHAVGWAFAAAGAAVLVTFIALVLLGAVQMLLLPDMTLAASRRGLTEPVKSLAIGFAVVVATPVALGLMVSTVIGLPLAVVFGATYLILLAMGFGVTASTIGRKGLRLLGRDWDGSALGRVGLIAVGLVVLGVVTLVPFLGILVVFLSLCLGIGAMAVEKVAARHR